MSHDILNGIVVLVALGAAAQWLAWRLRFPSILVLLTVGFVAGPATGLFRPEEVLGDLTFPFVSLAAAVVLFEGGLSASVEEIRGVATAVRRLVVVGIPVTWTVLTFAAHYALGLSIEISLLLGAILVVTGPTVIGPLLRHAHPTVRVASVLKLEGIINDPIGAILAVLVFQGIKAEEAERAFSVIAFGIFKATVISVAIGLVAAWIFVKLRERALLPDFLQNAIILPFVLIAYAMANSAQAESGLLAVTVMGIALASQKRVSIEQNLEFTEHTRVLLISALFILLTARMRLGDITDLKLGALLFVGVAIFVARPLAVALSTLGSELERNEKMFIAGIAPRGVVAAAVSSVFALELQESGYEEAAMLVPLTFVVIAATVLVSGLSSRPLVQWLGLERQSPQGVLLLGADELSRLIANSLGERGFRVILVDTDRVNVRLAREAGLEAHRGEILNRRLIHRLELDAIGHFAALTHDDDLNTLAVSHFRKLFGDANVHQLQPSTEAGYPRPEYAAELKGVLFAGGATRDQLLNLIKSGATITEASVEEGLTMEEIHGRFGEDAAPLFVIDDEEAALSFIDRGDALPSTGTLILLANSTRSAQRRDIGGR